MNSSQFEIVGNTYTDTDQVPLDNDLVCKCKLCEAMLPSLPKDNGGCKCGNVFIDKDYWRLVVDDFKQFEVWRKVPT